MTEWQEGQVWVCPHCNRECFIYRGVPQDSITRKRHSCEQYKKHVKANPKPRGSLSDTFAAHSEDRSGVLVEVPYAGSGRFVRKKWRSETKKIMREDQEITVPWGYMTDEVYQANKNMALFIAKYQRHMSEFYVPYDKQVYEYRHPVKRGVWGL
jgi:hypothetical protein